MMNQMMEWIQSFIASLPLLHQPLHRQILISSPRKKIPLTILLILLLLGSITNILIRILLLLSLNIMRILNLGQIAKMPIPSELRTPTVLHSLMSQKASMKQSESQQLALPPKLRNPQSKTIRK